MKYFLNSPVSTLLSDNKNKQGIRNLDTGLGWSLARIYGLYRVSAKMLPKLLESYFLRWNRIMAIFLQKFNFFEQSKYETLHQSQSLQFSQFLIFFFYVSPSESRI